jgi:ribosomal protein L11 methyltransferase
MSTSNASFCALVSTSEAAARHVLDALAESFDSADVVVSASEDRDGGWTVSLHFGAAPNETAVRALIGLAAGAETANALVFETVGATDWVQASLQGLTPVAAGRFIVHGAHDRGRVPPNRIGIEIEAALAFGTGHHGTTQGCLAAIERIAKTKRPKRILDIGTGTGVLAIAAARVWHRAVKATDIDPLSVTIARANAEANRAGAYVRVVRAAGVNAPAIRGRRYDLIIANILLPVLQRLARPVRLLSARGGSVILSGLLPEQANVALAVWRAQGFTRSRRDLVDGWVTLTLRLPQRSRLRRGGK